MVNCDSVHLLDQAVLRLLDGVDAIYVAYDHFDIGGAFRFLFEHGLLLLAVELILLRRL
jgi:hypothetical protein